MRIDCPYPEFPDAWIEVPDQWLGKHATKRDTAASIARDNKLTSTETNFAISAALLEDWGNIPGMNGNPDNWKFDEMSLSLIWWITEAVTIPYNMCFIVPKKKPKSLPASPLMSEMKTKAADGA